MDDALDKKGNLVDQFRQSMIIDHEKWHDGVGYDLSLLAHATTQERQSIEKLVIDRGGRDWRDIEALAALGTPASLAALQGLVASGSTEQILAIARYAPDLIPEAGRAASLVEALENTDFYGGLSEALAQVEECHPAPVLRALFRGVLHRAGPQACHFAAMLMYLYGQASSSFDWELRPFFLQFHTEDPVERQAMFRELCKRCGVDPHPYLNERISESENADEATGPS